MDDKARIGAIFIGSARDLVEWYDFYVYSAFSLYFADAFFPGDDPLAQMLSASGVFALGFFMRPIGAYIFGGIGDGRGRRLALLLSVRLMCAGSLIIALAPTYALVGAWAPALLLFARLLQGVSLGGEYGSSAVYLAETAPPARRCSPCRSSFSTRRRCAPGAGAFPSPLARCLPSRCCSCVAISPRRLLSRRNAAKQKRAPSPRSARISARRRRSSA